MTTHTTIDYFAAYATAATAIGTLSLAAVTLVLALKTRALAQSGQEQAVAARRQIEIGQAELAAAESTATEATRARIDAAAPMLGLTVALEGLSFAWGRDRRADVPLEDQRWPSAELEGDLFVEAPMSFVLTNWGCTPALVAIPSLIPDPEELLDRTGGSRQFILSPGAHYRDVQRYRLHWREALQGVACEIIATCNGSVSGATFDTLRWRGSLQPLRVDNGMVGRNDQIPLNASPAQMVREYPSLEPQEEMRELAERIRLGT